VEKCTEREATQAQRSNVLDADVKEAAGTNTDSTERLAELAELRPQGVVTDQSPNHKGKEADLTRMSLHLEEAEQLAGDGMMG
jgi:hypothetical protein